MSDVCVESEDEKGLILREKTKMRLIRLMRTFLISNWSVLEFGIMKPLKATKSKSYQLHTPHTLESIVNVPVGEKGQVLNLLYSIFCNISIQRKPQQVQNSCIRARCF